MIKYKKVHWRRQLLLVYFHAALLATVETSVDDSFEPTYFMLRYR